MKNQKKYAGLLLTLVLCLSMAACGGDDDVAPDTIKNLVTDTSVEYDYSALMGTWQNGDGSVLTMEHIDGITTSERFSIFDADNNLTASGNIQYVEEYGFVYLYNEHDGIAHISWINDDYSMYVDSFGAFTKVSGDIPGDTVGDLTGESVGDDYDFTMFSGSWYLDGDIYSSSCIEFDASGTVWSLYERGADGFFEGINGGTLRAVGENRFEAVSDWFEDESFDCYIADGMLYWGSEDSGYEVYY